MAAGDKIYLADKQTLDAVNTKVGATTDTGGSANAGTLMGKLNALISSLLNHVANWTAARAANLDAAVSTRESEASAAARHNALVSAINTGTAGVNKRLTAKKIVTSIPGRSTVTVLNFNGAGVFYGGYISTSPTNVKVTITIDGTPHLLGTAGGSGPFGRATQHPQMFSILSSGAGIIPAEFKSSIVVTAESIVDAATAFYCDYSLYE